MRTNIMKYSKLFFVLGLMISVKGYAQQDLLVKNEAGFQNEYLSVEKTMNNEPSFAIFPASVKNNASLMVTSDKDGWATFLVKTKSGKLLFEQQMAIVKGFNKIPVFLIEGMEKGTYSTTLKMEGRVYRSDLIKE